MSVVVKMGRDGIFLTVETLSPGIMQIIDETLSYTRVVQLRGNEARLAKSHVRLEPIACYDVRKDPDKIIPPYVVTGAGWLPALAAAFRERGYRPLLKIRGQHSKPEVFKPYWNRLQHVRWRYGQRGVIRQMLRHDLGRIDCPCGWGKSHVIGLMCLLWAKARIVVSTHAVDVIEQIYDDLARVLPEVGLICGRKKRVGERVVCVSGKSLHRVQWPVDVFFVDEIHEFATDDYLSRVASNWFKYARRYGLSASQKDRSDKAHFELEGAFGPIIASISYQEAEKHGAVVPIEVQWSDVVLDKDPCANYKTSMSRLRWGIWRNDVRNAAIAKDAKAIPRDEQVLISVDTIEHACFLKEHLPEFALCYSEQGMSSEEREWYIDNELLSRNTPEMTLERRQKLKKAFEQGRLKRVIATTVWKRGVDFTSLVHLIRADAGNSAISDTQLPGRTSRIYKDKKKGIIHDYKDQFSGLFRRRAADRRRNYKNKGWTQVDPDHGRCRFRQGELF